MKSKFITSVLFVACGIPGVFMFLVSSVVIAMRLLDPRIKGPRWLVLVTAGLIGIVLTLLGIGKLRRPAYALVEGRKGALNAFGSSTTMKGIDDRIQRNSRTGDYVGPIHLLYVLLTHDCFSRQRSVTCDCSMSTSIAWRCIK
jgi:hypothetical protein